MAENALEIPIVASGGDAAAREIAKPTAALGTFNTTATKTAATSGNLKTSFSGLAESSAKMTSIFSTLDQGTGVLTGTLGKASNAVAGLLGAIGTGGAMGAAGGLIAAVGILSTAFSAMNAETDRARVKLDELTKAANASDDALRRVAEASMSNSERLRARQAAAIAAENALEQPGQDAAAAANARDRARFESVLSAQGTAFQRGESRGGSGGRKRDDFNSFISSTAGRADFGLSEEGDPQNYGMNPNRRVNAMSDSVGSLTGSGKKTFDTSKAANQSINDAQRVQDAWQGAASTISDAMAGLVTDMITGSDMSAKAVVKGLGDQLVGMGVKDVFEGTAKAISSYGTDPAAWGLIAIGGAEIAAGAGMGAVAKSLPGGASTGSRPTPGAANDNGGGRTPGTTVINMYSLNPTAESARGIAKGLRMTERKSNKR